MLGSTYWLSRRLRRVIWLPLLFFCGCAAIPSPNAETADPAQAEEAATKTIPIHFATRAGQAFPIPLVYVTIAGEPSALILDTGSPFSVFSQSIVERLDLAVSSRKGSGIDAAGRTVHYRLLSAPQLVIEDLGPLTNKGVMVTQLPKIFDPLGIAGLLSPRQLAASGQAVVIDFEQNQLSIMSDSAALASLENRPHLQMSLKSATKSGKPRLYTLPVKIDGEPTQLLVDTGATSIYIYADSAKARQLAQRSGVATESVMVVTGEANYQLLPNASVRLGKALENAKVMLINKAQQDEDFEGILGMSLLQRCVLVLSSSKGIASCR